MRLDDDLYKEFLEEMNAIENFRIAYASAFPRVPLERDDPDVKRLMEAMAFFSARTKIAALSNVLAVQRRVFEQFFPFLLSTVPSMNTVQAQTTGQFVDPVYFPKGSLMSAPVPGEGTAIFRTMQDLRVLPVKLTGAKMALLPDKGYRFLLRLDAPFPRNDEIGMLRFYINHLNDYRASLKVLHSLRGHLRSVSVVFNEQAHEASCGIGCRTSFGVPVSSGADGDESLHPLLTERWFFHFPQQELYLNVDVPPPPRNWKNFTVCLDLDERWPRGVILNEDIFQLFAVPVANLRQAFAEPVICDGTQERYSIRHPHAEHRFELHSVLGVYEVKDRRSMVPLKPGIISGGSGSYEIDTNEVHDRSAPHSWLVPHFPEAFGSPKTLVVDALWYQPWYSDLIAQSRQVHPYDRTPVGVKWDWIGSPKAHVPNPLAKHRGFAQTFILANKTVLNVDDVGDLLRTLGTVNTGEFQNILPLMTGIRVESVPRQEGRNAGLIKHIYHLGFRYFDPVLRPLVEVFVRHVERILDSWISDVAIEVRIESIEEQSEARGV